MKKQELEDQFLRLFDKAIEFDISDRTAARAARALAEEYAAFVADQAAKGREKEIYAELLQAYRYEVEGFFRLKRGLAIAQNQIQLDNLNILTDIATQKVAALGRVLSQVGLGREAQLIIEEWENQ